MRDSLIESPLTSTLSHYRDWDGLKTLHCDGVCASWLLGIRKGWLYFWWKLKRNNTLVRPYWVGWFHDVEGKRLLIQGCFEPPRTISCSRRTQVSLGGKDRTQVNFIYPDHLCPTIRTTSVTVFGLVWIFGIFLFQAFDFPLVSDYLEPCGGSWTMIGQHYNCRVDPNKTWQELIPVWLVQVIAATLIYIIWFRTLSMFRC